MIGKYGIDEILCKWCDEASINYHAVYYTATRYIPTDKNECEIIIYYPFPGYLIGKAGVYVDKYKQELEKELNRKVKINFVEVSIPMSPEEWNKYFEARGF